MKRNRESACRQKIICTCHLDKQEQASLDRYVEETQMSYKEAWLVFRCSIPSLLSICACEPFKKLCGALELLGITADRAKEAFLMLGGLKDGTTDQ